MRSCDGGSSMPKVQRGGRGAEEAAVELGAEDVVGMIGRLVKYR